jgi:hypothetical protein
MLMDASGEEVAFVGFVWHPTVKSGTINIRKVHFRCGAVTLNVLSTFTVSLQGVSATAGPPYQPDGTTRGSGAGGFSNMTLTANAWNTSGAFAADVPVDLSVYGAGTANSRLLAVVFTNTFTALDSIIISSITTAGNTNPFTEIGGSGLLNTGAWAKLDLTSPVLVLECDDGTFAFMENGFPFSALSNATTATGGTFRAIGAKFSVPTERKLSTIGMLLAIQNGCDGNINLYQSGNDTALVSVPIDNDAVLIPSTSNPRWAIANITPITLAANTYYRLVFVPSTATAATVFYGDVNAAGHMDGCVLGQNAHYTTASDTPPTAWTDTTTRRAFFALGFSAFHDGAGGGGGMLFLPDMAGT